MFSRRTTIAILLCLVGALLLGAVLSGCESKPAAPQFTNPFDPLGPDGGDPLDLQATLADTLIFLSWSQPQGQDISHYDINHSLQYGSGYEYLATVDHTTAATNRYTYKNPSPTAVHYFRVQAFNAAGSFSIISAQVPAAVVTPPRVVIGADPARKTVASRYAELAVTVTLEDSIQIADNPQFTGAAAVPVAVPGQAQSVAWDFGPAAQDDTVAVYVRAFTGSAPSTTAVKTLVVDFAPGFTVVGNPPTVATGLVDLAVPIEGVVQMRFASGEAELANTAWVQAQEVLPDFPLLDSAAPQTVYGEFQGDFGFNAITTLTVAPDLLQDSTFQLDLPDDDVTASPNVRGLCSAVATLMRFATTPDFSGVPWQAYADTAAIDLGTAEGELTVYAQYRNDWTDSAILTDTVIHVRRLLSVRFAAPADGSVVLGGVPLQVQGTSSADDEDGEVDRVMVDLGDGAGFVPVTGLSPWSLMWDVPLFTQDTPLTLRARAWAAADSVTAVITVTVSQMTIAIVDPIDGAEIEGGTAVTISGTAAGPLPGPAVELVTVIAGEEELVVDGTSNWSAAWQTPAVIEPTEVLITAVAAGGGTAAAAEIAVTVVPAPGP